MLSALARLGVPHRVTGLVAAAENLPSGSAYRPGDVHHSCTAGRHGARCVSTPTPRGGWCWPTRWPTRRPTLEPDQIIDVATLTGAARVALGTTHAALYATDDGLAESLIGGR